MLQQSDKKPTVSIALEMIQYVLFILRSQNFSFLKSILFIYNTYAVSIPVINPIMTEKTNAPIKSKMIS